MIYITKGNNICFIWLCFSLPANSVWGKVFFVICNSLNKSWSQRREEERASLQLTDYTNRQRERKTEEYKEREKQKIKRDRKTKRK